MAVPTPTPVEIVTVKLIPRSGLSYASGPQMLVSPEGAGEYDRRIRICDAPKNLRDFPREAAGFRFEATWNSEAWLLGARLFS
jgi:hypothetical protein